MTEEFVLNLSDKQSQELTRVNPARNIFSINVELKSNFFTLQRFGSSSQLPYFKRSALRSYNITLTSNFYVNTFTAQTYPINAPGFLTKLRTAPFKTIYLPRFTGLGARTGLGGSLGFSGLSTLVSGRLGFATIILISPSVFFKTLAAVS